jgi:hypothetical protein
MPGRFATKFWPLAVVELGLCPGQVETHDSIGAFRPGWSGLKIFSDPGAWFPRNIAHSEMAGRNRCDLF